jgi:flagellar biosynthetic protein FlhB
VVANPTHICVALRYRPSEGAPIVIAKGYDEVAFYIRRLAEKHGITVVENKPLARALAETTKVGRTIPVELYQAVAQVLAFVYRLRGQTIRG